LGDYILRHNFGLIYEISKDIVTTKKTKMAIFDDTTLI